MNKKRLHLTTLTIAVSLLAAAPAAGAKTQSAEGLYKTLLANSLRTPHAYHQVSHNGTASGQDYESGRVDWSELNGTLYEIRQGRDAYELTPKRCYALSHNVPRQQFTSDVFPLDVPGSTTFTTPKRGVLAWTRKKTRQVAAAHGTITYNPATNLPTSAVQHDAGGNTYKTTISYTETPKTPTAKPLCKTA